MSMFQNKQLLHALCLDHEKRVVDREAEYTHKQRDIKARKLQASLLKLQQHKENIQSQHCLNNVKHGQSSENICNTRGKSRGEGLDGGVSLSADRVPGIVVVAC